MHKRSYFVLLKFTKYLLFLMKIIIFLEYLYIKLPPVGKKMTD